MTSTVTVTRPSKNMVVYTITLDVTQDQNDLKQNVQKGGMSNVEAIRQLTLRGIIEVQSIFGRAYRSFISGETSKIDAEAIASKARIDAEASLLKSAKTLEINLVD